METLRLLKLYPEPDTSNGELQKKATEGLERCNETSTPPAPLEDRFIPGDGVPPEPAKIPPPFGSPPLVSAAAIHTPPKIKAQNLGSKKGWGLVATMDVKPGR